MCVCVCVCLWFAGLLNCESGAREGKSKGRDLVSPACTGCPGPERSTQDAEQLIQNIPTDEGR